MSYHNQSFLTFKNTALNLPCIMVNPCELEATRLFQPTMLSHVRIVGYNLICYLVLEKCPTDLNIFLAPTSFGNRERNIPTFNMIVLVVLV